MNIDNYFRGRNWHTAAPWAKLCSFILVQPRELRMGFTFLKNQKISLQIRVYEIHSLVSINTVL